jgi:hypothetical protein
MAKKNNVATPGSISHGTLKAEDLLSAFLDYLRQLDETKHAEVNRQFGDDLIAAALADPTDVSEVVADTLNTMYDLLNDEYAPDGYHFGAHEGDGADFGFWLNEDQDGNEEEGDDE